jgi:hypothetical protein
MDARTHLVEQNCRLYELRRIAKIKSGQVR